MSPSLEPFDEIKYKVLIDGLKCREIVHSETRINKDWRIDSDFYTTKLYHNPSIEYSAIGRHLVKSTYGVSIDMNEEGDGYPIYRMNEIHNMLCDLDVMKYAKLSSDDFKKYELHNGDVLFNRTNSYEWVGRTGIYYDANVKKVYASYLVRLVPNTDTILPEYLTAFLSSSYGVADIKRRARQSVNQTNVNPEEVKEILIPLLKIATQKKIKAYFMKAHVNRVYAKELYSQAEQLLLSGLSHSDSMPSASGFSVVSLSDSFLASGRLDAEYYQVKYNDYENMLSTKDTIASLCNVYDKTFEPLENEEYKYIELSNVGIDGSITDVGKMLGRDLPSRARRRVKTGQVIIASVEGSLQSCALVTDEYNNALCSTGFHVIDSKFINSETLLVLFKSKPIQEMLKQRCSGTILTNISKNELLLMPFPKINDEIQKLIASKIQKSYEQRRRSTTLLEYAIKIVEVAIENGEENAINWSKGKEQEEDAE